MMMMMSHTWPMPWEHENGNNDEATMWPQHDNDNDMPMVNATVI